MINDKEFLKFEEGFFKPYFEKFIESAKVYEDNQM